MRIGTLVKTPVNGVGVVIEINQKAYVPDKADL